MAQLAPPTQWQNARDVSSEKAIKESAAQAKPMNEQVAAMMKPLPEVRPNAESSLYKKSIILFDGERYTLVPVGSVLHLPPTLRDRVIAKPQGDFTFWPDFLKRNSAWLAGKEVPLKMAQGDAKLAAIVFRGTVKSSRLLVSVYRECPISILQSAPEPEASAASNP